MDDLDPNNLSLSGVNPLAEITNRNETRESSPNVLETNNSSMSNKENKGFMKRILGGRHTKTSKSSNVAGSKDAVKVQESRLLKTSVTPSTST